MEGKKITEENPEAEAAERPEPILVEDLSDDD